MNTRIPKQMQGHQLDCCDAAQFETCAQASDFYDVAKNRLLSIEQWDEISVFSAATFSLHRGHTGLQEDNTLKKGDFVKIKVPFESRSNKEGYDWVRIEAIEST